MLIVSNELKLRAESARDVMTPSPLSISQERTLQEAAAFLIKHDISGAPVIDSRGRPIGVITHTDIVRHVREFAVAAGPRDYYRELDLTSADALEAGLPFELKALTPVTQIMMPLVFSVSVNAPVSLAIELMLAEGVHRVFVTDNDGTLVGVISAFDVLSRLMP